MLRLLFAFSGLLWVTLVSGQFCGTPQQPLLDRVDELKKSPAFGERSAQKYIPVTFHLVANNGGTGRVQEEQVLLQIANLNSQYADQMAVFYIDHFNYFDNDAVYNTPDAPAAITQMRLRKDNNSLNLFITNTAENGGGSPGVVLAYYEPNEDWVVSRRDQISSISSTIAHEFGHFFSLPHPFSGWDCKPYTTTDYTNPVNVDFTKPCDAGGGSALIELQDGSNCNTAGDHICDTPPDYNLGLLYQNDCSENTTVKDKNNQLITPIVNNYMSYYHGCGSYTFTPNQKTLINTSFLSAQRAFIRTGVVPNTTPVTGPVSYVYPINGEMTPSPTGIVLNWEDTPGANRYMILVARNMSFTQSPQKLFSLQSTVTIPGGLSTGATYYWKVWPYNESQTGAMYSATQNFIVGTGVGVNDIKEINSYSLDPNPVSLEQEAVLNMSSVKSFDAIMKVSNSSGQILSTQSIKIPSGDSQQTINTTGFPSGIYFVMIHSAGGSLVERLLITE
ncbi:MAG: T9SS type A sorting domain-containing protein [Saprospiraceae bacterium]